MKKIDRRIADSDSRPPAPQAEKKTESRWSAVRQVRLPHKVGMPLGSGGGGDAVSR